MANAHQIKSVADAFISIFQIKFSKENVIPQSIGAKPALHLQCLSTFEKKNVSVEINEVFRSPGKTKILKLYIYHVI